MCFPVTRAPQCNPKAPHAPLCPGWGEHNASLAAKPQERGKGEGEGKRILHASRGPALPLLDDRQHSRFGEPVPWPPSTCTSIRVVFSSFSVLPLFLVLVSSRLFNSSLFPPTPTPKHIISNCNASHQGCPPSPHEVATNTPALGSTEMTTLCMQLITRGAPPSPRQMTASTPALGSPCNGHPPHAHAFLSCPNLFPCFFFFLSLFLSRRVFTM